jgi:hypothetical protein
MPLNDYLNAIRAIMLELKINILPACEKLIVEVNTQQKSIH